MWSELRTMTSTDLVKIYELPQLTFKYIATGKADVFK
jgi:hypothetical protein